MKVKKKTTHSKLVEYQVQCLKLVYFEDFMLKNRILSKYFKMFSTFFHNFLLFETDFWRKNSIFFENNRTII